MAESKWSDAEDAKAFAADEVATVHRKLLRKGGVLAEELRGFAQAGASPQFTAWATQAPAARGASRAGELLRQDTLQRASKAKAPPIRKVAQTAAEDSLRAVVQTVDKAPGAALYAFGGFDKVLKLCRLTFDRRKNYEVAESLYFEGLPLVHAQFASDRRLALGFLKKPFFGLFDLEKKALEHFHKVFPVKAEVEKVCLSPARTRLLASSRTGLSLVDVRLRSPCASAQLGSQVVDTAFLREHLVAAALGSFQVQFFDLRKSLALPSRALAADCSRIAGLDSLFATGNKNGVVRVFDADAEMALLKTFDQLSTAVTTLGLSEGHLVFGSKWKRNAVRVANCDSFRVVPQWPNAKTALNVVSASHVSAEGLAAFGTSKGGLHVYQLAKH